jgi:hypothetical protein
LITPKAFANFSPGLEQPWVSVLTTVVTLKALANSAHLLANAFSVASEKRNQPQGWNNPGLKLANAFGVNQTDAPPGRNPN